MTFCAAKGASQIFPASILRSRQESNTTIKAVFDTTLQLVIRLQKGVQRRLILPNERTDATVLMPIGLIREKLSDRDQKKTNSRLQFQYVFSHPRPTSSTLMRRVEGRGFLMRQQQNREKESLHTILPTSLITPLALSPLSHITASNRRKRLLGKRKRTTAHSSFQVVGHFS